jgi:hypothetical protein
MYLDGNSLRSQCFDSLLPPKLCSGTQMLLMPFLKGQNNTIMSFDRTRNMKVSLAGHSPRSAVVSYRIGSELEIEDEYQEHGRHKALHSRCMGL